MFWFRTIGIKFKTIILNKQLSSIIQLQTMIGYQDDLIEPWGDYNSRFNQPRTIERNSIAIQISNISKTKSLKQKMTKTLESIRLTRINFDHRSTKQLPKTNVQEYFKKKINKITLNPIVEFNEKKPIHSFHMYPSVRKQLQTQRKIYLLLKKEQHEKRNRKSVGKLEGLSHKESLKEQTQLETLKLLSNRVILHQGFRQKSRKLLKIQNHD